MDETNQRTAETETAEDRQALILQLQQDAIAESERLAEKPVLPEPPTLPRIALSEDQLAAKG
jgi:hypothetical protein